MSEDGELKRLFSQLGSTIGSILTTVEHTMTILGHSLASSSGVDIQIKGLRIELSTGRRRWSTGPHDINIGSKSTRAAAGRSSSRDQKSEDGASGSKKSSR